MGRIEKSEYYIDRVMRGKTEARFSQQKKMSLSTTNRKFRNFKVKTQKIKHDGYFNNFKNPGEIQSPKTI